MHHCDIPAIKNSYSCWFNIFMRDNSKSAEIWQSVSPINGNGLQLQCCWTVCLHSYILPDEKDNKTKYEFCKRTYKTKIPESWHFHYTIYSSSNFDRWFHCMHFCIWQTLCMMVVVCPMALWYAINQIACTWHSVQHIGLSGGFPPIKASNSIR